MMYPKNDFRDYICHSDEYLMHYGVLGMKWGMHKHPYDEEKENRDDLARAAQYHAIRKNKKDYKYGLIDRTSRKNADRLAKQLYKDAIKANKKLRKSRKKLSKADQIKYKEESRENLYAALGDKGIKRLLSTRPQNRIQSMGLYPLGAIGGAIYGGANEYDKIKALEQYNPDWNKKTKKL